METQAAQSQVHRGQYPLLLPQSQGKKRWLCWTTVSGFPILSFLQCFCLGGRQGVETVSLWSPDWPRKILHSPNWLQQLMIILPQPCKCWDCTTSSFITDFLALDPYPTLRTFGPWELLPTLPDLQPSVSRILLNSCNPWNWRGRTKSLREVYIT